MGKKRCKVRVKVSGVSHGQATGINSLNTQSAKDAALSNPIILDKIIDFLKSTKTLRLVSKEWNDAFLSGQPRLTLKPNSTNMPDVASLSEWGHLLDTLNPKLCKRIFLDDFRNTESQNVQLNPEKLFLICEKYGTYITQLSVYWESVIVHTLVQILSGDSCPNIANLTIIIRGFPLNPDTTMPKNMNRNFQIKSKLTQITILCLSEPPAITQSPWSHIIYTLFNHLLAASPNLLDLFMRSSVCPSLEWNKKLKSLRFSSTHNDVFCPNDPSFNLAQLSLILDQVKDSLETLSIETYSTHVDCGGCDLSSRHFQLPIMPKLVSFTSKYLTVAGVGGVLRPLWINRMPSLTSLSIDLRVTDPKSQKIVSLQNILNIENYDDDGVPLRNIKSLILKYLDEDRSKIISQLKCPFPGLTSLNLFLTQEKIPTGEWMGQVLKSCSTLGLCCLKIRSTFSYKMSQTVDLLWGCREELFSSLKTLEIINQGEATDDLTEDGRAKFRSILLMAKGMKRLHLHGFLLRARHAKNVFEYIADNQLPVLFTDSPIFDSV